MSTNKRDTGNPYISSSIRKLLRLWVFAASACAAAAFIFACFPAGALAQISAREINLQNIALNKCEQYLKVNKIELAAKSFEEASSYERAAEANPNYKKVKETFERKKKEYIKDLTDKGNQFFLEKKFED